MERYWQDLCFFLRVIHICRFHARWVRLKIGIELFASICEFHVGPRPLILNSAKEKNKWRARNGESTKRCGERKSSGVLDKRLGGNTSTNQVLFNLHPSLFSPFYALRAHRCRCIYSVWSVYVWKRGGKVGAK